jgi:hypothetical protein
MIKKSNYMINKIYITYDVFNCMPNLLNQAYN